MTAIVTESIVPGKPVSLDRMGAAQRLEVVAAAIRRPPGVTLAEVRRPFGVGRTWLFEARRRAQEALKPRPHGPAPQDNELRNLREQVQRLQAENATLKAALDDADSHAARSVEVTPERIWGTVAELAVSPVSTRDIHSNLVQAFGPEYAPADNTIARHINVLGHLAGVLLDECGATDRFEQARPQGDRSAKGWRQSSRDGGDYRGASSILLGLSGEGAVERGAVHAQLLGDLPS